MHVYCGLDLNGRSGGRSRVRFRAAVRAKRWEEAWQFPGEPVPTGTCSGRRTVTGGGGSSERALGTRGGVLVRSSRALDAKDAQLWLQGGVGGKRVSARGERFDSIGNCRFGQLSW